MRYPLGQFSWIDLMTPDTTRSADFYTRLFDWRRRDTPTRMGPLPEKVGAAGVPLAWSLSINMVDLEATLERVREVGGFVMMEPMDVMTQGGQVGRAIRGAYPPDRYQVLGCRQADLKWAPLYQLV